MERDETNTRGRGFRRGRRLPFSDGGGAAAAATTTPRGICSAYEYTPEPAGGASTGPETSSGGGEDAPGGGPRPVGGVESLGLVDDGAATEQLIAEAEAIAGGVPLDAAAAGEGGAALAVNGSWSQLAPPLVKTACGVVLPAWEIRVEEEQALSESMAECLEQLFPGGVDGKYACWVRLIFTCSAITISRVQTYGYLPPLFLPKGSKPKAKPVNVVRPEQVNSLTE